MENNHEKTISLNKDNNEKEILANKENNEKAILLNKNNNTKTISLDKKDLRCAPNKKFMDGSCISLDILIEMAKAYNHTDSKNPIKLSTTVETLNPKKYKLYLLNEFSKRLDKVCDNQRCWVKQDFIEKMNQNSKEDLKINTYRPAGPEGKFSWLNTININEVMTQYQNKDPSFKYLGAVPIDFDDLPMLNISNLNFKELYKEEIRKLGIVFNLDKHYQQGSHWVSLFANFDKGEIYFFDSYGIKPKLEIRRLMRRLATFIKDDLKKPPIVDYNRIRFQKDNNSCGLYSSYFIISMLEGKSFQDLLRKEKTNDEMMQKLRDIYFV